MEIQKTFFEIAKKKMPSNFLLADIVGEVLGVGTDSAYRRIRGEKELSISELSKLCQHFDISMDSIVNHQSSNISFRYSPLDLSNMENYYVYMDNLSMLLETNSKAKEKEMFLMAIDIPAPHFAAYLDLTLFKVYTWFHSIKNLQLTYDEFVESIDVNQLAGYYNKMRDAYKQTPSTEIWTNNTIEPILRLIDYYADLNCFKKKETLYLICHQLLQLIEEIERNTENESTEFNGKKSFFRLYLSPIDIMNDFSISKRDGVSVVSMKLYTINALFTSNDYFCNEVEGWMKNTMSKSLYLSGASAKERFKFFQQMKNKVNNLLEKFEKLKY